MPRRTVFVVDDDAGVREGLSFLLRAAGYEVVAYASAAAFLAAYDPEKDDPEQGCLLLDAHMPSMTGLEMQHELNRRGWTLPVVFVTGRATVPMAIDAIKAGAFDLIEKPVREDLLLDVLRRAFVEYNTAHAERLERAQAETRVAALSPREREVLALVAAGEPSKVIARRLGISFRTVEVHRANITQKLQARGPGDLVRIGSAVSRTRSS